MTEQKIEAFWRDANAGDVMNGKEIEARFRDDESFEWSTGKGCLIGYKQVIQKPCFWISRSLGWKNYEMLWRFCQVYDPPQWWLDKPDPGKGYRLLEKFPAEELQPEDDWWGIESKDWLPSRRACRGEQQDEDVWYRRRIEPVEPEPKHYVLRVGDSCETPCGNLIRVIPQGGIQRFFNLKAGDTIKTMHGQTITITEKGFEVY
jgi:hypothetical protein